MQFNVKNSEIIVPGSAGVEKYKVKENLWSSKETNCRKIQASDWKKAKIQKISSWKNQGDKFSLDLFKDFSLDKLFTRSRYFYTASIYADKPGNLSEEIFKDWDLKDSEAEDFKGQNPVEFKTLNLVKIMKILNSVAADMFEPTLVANVALNFNLLKK